MLSLDIIDNLGVVVHQYKGTVTPKELGNAWNTFMHLKVFRENKYDLISNYGNARFDFKIEDLEIAKKFLRKHRQTLIGKREAIVTNDPYTVALCVLFKHHAEREAGLTVNIFSSEEGALKWLLNRNLPCYCKIKQCQKQRKESKFTAICEIENELSKV